ncbi:serine threonine protein kinase : Serine/threonine protein kinase OS=Rhodopirellula europaea 6C GN=RE6C_01857 PE=3 SV=1: Pkinase [Gemmataceae bacterium]|nr:serine threonine protein kinase : Serine/threonine protein kinase OS=Rhodopirellula europaea 6C GN=RE6C_01857 PE=3 SV=1: Pkinase [Gemmataceae bacterium]VTT97758.1 serine threonine protein kinase : Serine/threonine protein kinase OS=Rhodopirellula europaea 6C GN=RE6C_01857 PE=3 SV=1: Pkinase [Gemmataceae bacterium]
MTSPITAPAGSPPAAISREKFLASVRAANLFPPMLLAKVEASVPAAAASAADAARALIAAGHLTRFQAERLLAGRSDGFHLGPYVILDQVGRGPMGRVYKARHQTMNRPVAVKVLAANLTDTPAARQAIQSEVRAAAQLNHPNIVTAYDANEINNRFYLVLELVDGPNLETLIKERGPLPVSEACELLWQAAAGLEHAHARKMLHKDLKPTNLLVSRPSKTAPELLLKIADFGVAKFSPTNEALAQTPSPGSWLGTADYTAPEQTNHPQHADKAADLYSLGAVGYFLLTGQPPFPGGTVDEKARRHLWEEPARLELVRPDTPPALAALLHQMLAKNPAHRPGSAAEVVARIENILSSFGDSISFDLPQQQGGQYSFVAGQLSGVLSAPPSSGHYPVPPPSGAYHTPPGSGHYAVPPAAHYPPVPGSGYYPVPPHPDQTPSPPVPMPRPQPPQPAPARAGNPNLQSWSQIAAAGRAEEEAEEERPSRRAPARGRGRSRYQPEGGGMVTTLIVIVLTIAAFAGMGLALKTFVK